ncbi:hypothetical protein [Xenorhabdus entomophaga]|uniref:hypothetical protein n=1 Tax=Xenorhabdus entomophaga TaxID=3136257 RepID=UPI0030F40315
MTARNRLNKEDIVDGLIFTSNDDPNRKIVFNFHTWVEMLKAIIVKYANKLQDEAESLVMNYPGVYTPVEDYSDVEFMSHDYEYHWAMEIVYGGQYWLKGIPSDLPEGFIEWDDQHRKAHNLAEDSFEYIDE